jgi:hypothetical protein
MYQVGSVSPPPPNRERKKPREVAEEHIDIIFRFQTKPSRKPPRSRQQAKILVSGFLLGLVWNLKHLKHQLTFSEIQGITCQKSEQLITTLKR